MRTHAFRLFALVSMLALLFGAQVCMLFQCTPKQARPAAHACCAAAAAKSAPGAPVPHESVKPCCVQVTLAGAPTLEPPVAVDAFAPFALLAAFAFDAAPAAAFAPSPPGDAAPPPAGPPLAAAGSRAPPRA